MQQSKERYSFGRLARNVAMGTAVIWGMGRAMEVKQPQVAELFSNRPSLSQMFTGDIGFGNRADRHSHVEVVYHGKSVAAIPSSSFGQPQGGFDQAPVSRTNSHRERQATKTNHKARQSEQWVAQAGSAARENRAVEALNTRVQMASIASQTETPRNEPLLPFGTFEEVSPVAYAALLPFGKFNKRRALLLASLSAVLASCASPATAPVIITETRPAPAITAPAIATETLTPPPGFQTETPPPPVDLASVHPDFHDAGIFDQVTFSAGATPDQLTAANPLGLPTYALDAYSKNIEAIEAKVTGEQGAKVFWSADYSKNFVLLTRVNGGVTEVAVIAAGADNISYHPNAEWFDFAPTEAPKYIWVALPSGYTAESLIGGYKGEYPVWGVADAEHMPAVVYAPGSDAQFVENPAVVAQFAIESLTIAPEQAAAMRAHSGLEASITAEAEGRFSTTVQVLNTQNQPVTETMQVDPNTLHEDLASKNEYGNTPVMTTVDGKKLYWIQETRAWYSVDLSIDPSKPVFIPFEHPEIALRVVIAEFGQPFPSEALARWLHTGGIKMMNIYVVKNAITGEDSKFGFFKNLSLNEPGITAENSPVQIVNTWFRTQLPDGTTYTYFPTKWLDPKSGTDPSGDDWKIILCGVGDEIMGDEGNMQAFLNLLKQQFQSGQHSQISPIFRAEDGFFNSIGPIITLGVPQPSLEKLMDISGPSIDRLKNPGFDDTPYSMTFDYNFNQLSQNYPAGIAGIDRTDPKYHGFFPDQIQKIIFPTMIIFH